MNKLFLVTLGPLAFFTLLGSCQDGGKPTAPAYKVTYHGNGQTAGAVPVDDHEYQAAASVLVLGNIGGLVKDGHSLAAWNTRSDGGGDAYVAGDSFSMPAAAVDLWAKWQALVYTLSYSAGSHGSIDGPALQSVAHGSDASPVTAVPDSGYHFRARRLKIYMT